MENNKRIFIFAAFVTLSLLSNATGQIKVVTTLTDLKSITEYIGGDRVDVFAIATGYQNPHFVDPKPS